MFDMYFVLTMEAHGLVAREREMHGVHVRRYLNAAGRWAGGGKKVPVLVWTDQDKAKEAAAVATAARKRPVTVTLSGGSAWTMGKSICLFSDAVNFPALSGYTDGT